MFSSVQFWLRQKLDTEGSDAYSGSEANNSDLGWDRGLWCSLGLAAVEVKYFRNISVTSQHFELWGGFCWHQKWGEPSPQTQGHLQTLGSQYLQHICYFSFEVFLGNGMEETLPEGIWLKIRRGSKIFTVKDYQMANIRQSTGTGIILIKDSCSFYFSDI